MKDIKGVVQKMARNGRKMNYCYYSFGESVFTWTKNPVVGQWTKVLGGKKHIVQTLL